MALHYENLDESTRSFMLDEVGQQSYVSLLKEAIEHYDDAWFASQLRSRGYIKDYEQRRKRGGGFTHARVPVNAPETLSEGEFNRYYVRGLCIRVVQDGMNQVEVYRGKQVSQPRPESEALLGKSLSAKALLEDLRKSKGVEPALGLPSGPNSGLTIRMGEA